MILKYIRMYNCLYILLKYETHDAMKLVLCLNQSHRIVGVDHVDDGTNVGVVVSPERSQHLLAAHVPYSHL